MRVHAGNVSGEPVFWILALPFVALAQIISIPFRILVWMANQRRRRH